MTFLLVSGVLVAPAVAQGLVFADYDDQDAFNNFSGNRGLLEGAPGTTSTEFSRDDCRSGRNACLRVNYSVPQGGYSGIWNSTVGRNNFATLTLNFLDLYGDLANSSANPTNINTVGVVSFSFWAKGAGNGTGSFSHKVKVEFKDGAAVATKLFEIPNQNDWTRYAFPVTEMTNINLTHVKELNFVLSDFQNDNRSSHLFLDDLVLNTNETPYAPATFTDDQLLDVVSHRAFGYFLRFTDTMGFVHDRSSFSDLVSVASIGHQLAAYCVGARRGWAPGLEQRVETILRNLTMLPMAQSQPTAGNIAHAGYRGLFYHFLEANTTQDPANSHRKNVETELSLYDTMLLIYGVLTAQACFPANTNIRTYAGQLYDAVEWDWLVDSAPGPNQDQFYLGWTPELGFLGHVDGYTDEAMLVDVLALGSNTHPVTVATYRARGRPVSNGIAAAWTGSLFNYTFAAGWLDYERMGADIHAQPIDVWTNNRLAVQASRQFAIDHADNTPADGDDSYTTYGPASWGLTASDNVAPPNSILLSEYFAFGALPTEQNIRNSNTKAPHVGTVAVYGAAGATPFTPAEATAALRHFLTIPGLWMPLFGFGDAFSTDPHYYEADAAGAPILDADDNLKVHPATWLNGSWVNHVLMGINEGPMLLALENHRSGLIWSLTKETASIRRGLLAIMGGFTDPVVAPGDPIRAVHVAELRTRIDTLRARYALPQFNWGGVLAAQQTEIKADHLTDLRTALDRVYDEAQIARPAYTDPALAGVLVKAVHIMELRSFLFRLE